MKSKLQLLRNIKLTIYLIIFCKVDTSYNNSLFYRSLFLLFLPIYFVPDALPPSLQSTNKSAPLFSSNKSAFCLHSIIDYSLPTFFTAQVKYINKNYFGNFSKTKHQRNSVLRKFFILLGENFV